MTISLKSGSITLVLILCALLQGCGGDKPALPVCVHGDDIIKKECRCGKEDCTVGQKCPKADSPKCTDLPKALIFPYHPPDTEIAFADFESRFGKKYDIASGEREERKKIFTANLKFISDFNSDEKHTITLGVGPFADLSEEEFKEYVSRGKVDLNKVESPWGNLPKRGTVKSVDEKFLPESIDWLEKGGVTHVKNQGRCGSCWSFSTTGALEGHLFQSSGMLTELSEQNLLDCDRTDKRCQGGIMDHAFEYVQRNGLYTEEDYPYKCLNESSTECRESKCHSCTGSLAIRPFELSGWVDIMHETKALMYALTHGPVSIAIEADTREFQHYTGGVLTSPYCGHQLDHGVLAVGYGVDEEGTKYWLVKNSWGQYWGANGYIKIGRDIEETMGGECGILKMASYPVLAYEDQLPKQRMSLVIV